MTYEVIFAPSARRELASVPERVIPAIIEFVYGDLAASPRRVGKPLERDVLKQIIHVLRHDPRVVRVERNQSGVFQDGNRYVKVGRRGDPDIGGMLKGGRTFAIEVKRPGFNPDPLQQKRLDEIAAAGGLAGCAHSVEEAVLIVEGEHVDKLGA